MHLLPDIRQPLLFVAVGEVKAGKSSPPQCPFGHEFAKTGVLPATDRVCIFRYGEVEKTVDVSPQLIERFLAIDFLAQLQRRRYSRHQYHGRGSTSASPRNSSRVPISCSSFFCGQSLDAIGLQDFLAFVKALAEKYRFVLQQADLREPEIAVIRRHHGTPRCKARDHPTYLLRFPRVRRYSARHLVRRTLPALRKKSRNCSWRSTSI